MPIVTPVRVALLAAIFAVPGTHAVAAERSDTWFVTGTKLYVGPDTAPIDNGVVLVRDGKIAAAGKAGAVRIPAGARQSQCASGVITAGFQNSHVHFTGERDLFADAGKASPEQLSRHLQDMLTRFGFTTVVDTASDRDNTLALRARIESGELRGPRILTVGLPLYPPDGIPVYLANLPKPLLDRFALPETPEAAVAVVRENIAAGTDGTKLFVATPQADWSVKRMPADIASAAVAETHRLGKLAMAHPTDIEGIRAALAAKADILVHTTLGVRSAWPDALVQQLVERGVSVVPTLQLWGYELDKSKTPAEVRTMLIGHTIDQLKGFAAAGGQVLFGTDVGYMTDFDPGEEYALMARAGLTPMQILASLTTAPAARWKESRRRGRLDAGMDADIVVLEADPAADPRNFAKVRCVFRGGAEIYRHSGI